MADINDLLQDFWSSSNGAVGVSLTAMCRVFGILRKCFKFKFLKVCFNVIPVFVGCVDLADNNLQKSSNRDTWHYRDESLDVRMVFHGYRKMIYQSFSESNLGDILRFLPGVVVQENLSMQGMADLYRIKPDFLKRLKSLGLLRPSPHGLHPGYMLDDYLSGFLQDRHSSHHYYCDPELQHISICLQILSLSYQSNVFDLLS